MSEAISLLEPLTSDVVDFVRQGALIAMAMVMVQMNEASDSRVGSFRYTDYILNLVFFFSASDLPQDFYLYVFTTFDLGDNWRKLF